MSRSVEVVRSAEDLGIVGALISIARADHVPERRRPDGVRVLLPADEPGVRGSGRRAASARRPRARRADVGDDPDAPPVRAVLHEPRVRVRRRELRREHGLRPRLPRAVVRSVGRRRRRGLHRRGAVPRRRGSGRRRTVRRDRRERRRLHRAGFARVPSAFVRGGHQLLRRRGPRAVRDLHAQVRAQVHRPARRSVSGDGGVGGASGRRSARPTESSGRS